MGNNNMKFFLEYKDFESNFSLSNTLPQAKNPPESHIRMPESNIRIPKYNFSTPESHFSTLN